MNKFINSRSFRLQSRNTAPAIVIALALLLSSSSSDAYGPPGHQVDEGLSANNQFDVISIRASDPASSGFSIRPDPDNFKMTGASLKFLIQYAFDLHAVQVENAPAWTRSIHFDISAKMDAPTHFPEASGSRDAWQPRQKLLEARLRSLLATRFGLRTHKSERVLSIYELTIGKGGAKLLAGTDNTGYTTSPTTLTCSYSSMDNLASILADILDRIVVNRTGLTGAYRFTLKWSRDDSTLADASTPGIFTALNEQLGLRLKSAKSSVNTLFVDSVDQPSPN